MSDPNATEPQQENVAVSRQERIDAAALEFHNAVARAEAPEIDTFVLRYPDLASDLRDLLSNATSLDTILTPDRSALLAPRSQSVAPLRLTAVEGPICGQTLTIDKSGNFLLGRSSRARFRFPSGPDGDLRISHAHCLIEFDPPHCRVHDLKSRNGTYVNGARIASSFLRDGDELRVGRSILRVELHAPAEDAEQGWPRMTGDSNAIHEVQPQRAAVDRTTCAACLHPKRKLQDALCARCHARAALIPQPAPGYRLVREVGRSTLGVVYLALSEKENRAVALKLVEAASAPKPVHLARFLHEMEALKRLRHRHIVTVRDVGSVGGIIYLATEFIRGTDATRLLKKQGALPVHVAVRIVCQTLSGLKAAHAAQLVHGDLKPANVLIKIRPDSRSVRIADLGLARAYRNSHVGGHTLPCDFAGVTAFMAPEQVLDYRGQTPAADQYSAAAVLYQLLTNALVYDQPKSVVAQFAQILDEDIVPIRDRRAALPPKLISVIHRALSREPERRFPDVAEFKKALLPFGEATSNS